jgi:hypothetical protein
MNIDPNYSSNRDARVGVPYEYAQYDNYRRSGGVRRKSRKSRKSRKHKRRNTHKK